MAKENSKSEQKRKQVQKKSDKEKMARITFKRSQWFRQEYRKEGDTMELDAATAKAYAGRSDLVIEFL